MRRRLFTLAEANAKLAWLESQFAEADSVRSALANQHQRLQGQHRTGKRNGGSEHADELTAAQRQIEKLERQLVTIVEGIQSQGIQVRDLNTGLVDFPGLRNGVEVHLCWHRGEADIRYWHPTSTGFAGRQPL